LIRALFTIAAIALISAGIAHLRDSTVHQSAFAESQELTWVRTVDGWEPSSVLTAGPPPEGAPSVHPALIATLQLGLSLFALLALPTTNLAVRKS